ncbi:DUF2383 domain-containing protein [Mariniflexile litorale]|uniref:DUF2383 domain-containing protein n=1 Tax=Mariniflexile litorale TaxID=3045158 RepID=A0AAU7EJB5_9FLAO|nr:DUF2383 domain-containing protein [Mariniflexile sp. KMM 9835]MDQ8210971.1 DUF2383 domain-containing protein [Mariniflexile sp. KMM 9835]
MKSSEKILGKLNGLLLMNYETEKVYLEALDLATDDNLKAFFRERGFERNEFGRQLRAEIVKLNGKPKEFGVLSSYFDRILTNFKDYFLLNIENDLIEEVYSLKRSSIEKYNELLREINLPLSTCKLLVKQRDSIYSHMNAMKRQEEFVV